MNVELNFQLAAEEKEERKQLNTQYQLDFPILTRIRPCFVLEVTNSCMWFKNIMEH